MRNKKGYTPREEAYDIAIGWLSNVYKRYTNDIENIEGSPAFRKEVRKQVAKLHNRLAEKVYLDIIPLGEE